LLLSFASLKHCTVELSAVALLAVVTLAHRSRDFTLLYRKYQSQHAA
jgi:hypothetical protein